MNNNQFNSGSFFITSGVRELLETYKSFRLGIFGALENHCKGNWFETCEDDKKQNVKALKTGGRIFSAWTIAGHRVYIITNRREQDRLVAVDDMETRVLLQSEY